MKEGSFAAQPDGCGSSRVELCHFHCCSHCMWEGEAMREGLRIAGADALEDDQDASGCL